MTHNPSDADVLDQTHDLIAANGWCQHVLQDDQGRFCLRGAIFETLSYPSATPYVTRWRSIEHRIETLISPSEIVEWNNAPERTIDEVLDVLVKAAHNAREGLS